VTTTIDEAATPHGLVDLLSSALQEAIARIALPDPELRLYTPEAAAELLGVTENWINDRIKARTIPFTFPGRGRFPRFTAQHIRAIAAMGEVDPTTYGR